MWARISNFEGPVGQVESSIDDSRDILEDLTRRIPGSRGAYYLVDRETGRSLAMTLWESEDALRESEREAGRIREEATAQTGETIVSVERYEVVVQPSDMLKA